MALGDTYATIDELKSYLKIDDAVDDSELSDALESASREVEKYCNRQFNDSGATSARLYYPETCGLVYVDDFSTTTGLVVETDEGDDGTFETTWSAADYQLEPLNGVSDGEPGWPYNRIRAVKLRSFPRGRRATVRVTAQWGWSSVPAPVKQATLIIASENFKLKDAPFGIAGFGEFGVVRVRDNPMAAKKLARYKRDAVLVG